MRLRLALPLALALLPAAAGAWSDHAVATRLALRELPALRGARVRAEPLAAFLAAEAERLEPLLLAHEAWARAQVPAWPPLPEGLAFRAAPREGIRERFLGAIRANPTVPLGLFLQPPPGEAPPAGVPPLPARAVMVVRPSADPPSFLPLAEGQEVAALDVVATAADEPDHGLDVGLFADNGTAWGARYRLGRQPFGNPALDFGSQAPFHMGFYWEDSLTYRAAPELRRTFPEVRVHLFRALSALAFQSGHAYWGWRFAGFALHYLQDLTQPWHARALPGVGFWGVAWRQALDLVGLHGPRAHAIALVSNRHLALESYAAARLRAALAGGRTDDLLVAALADGSADGSWPASDANLRDPIARRAHAAADPLDAAVRAAFPARYVSDPEVTLDDTRERLDLLAVARQGDPAAEEKLARLVAERLRSLGAASRNLVRSLPAPASP